MNPMLHTQHGAAAACIVLFLAAGSKSQQLEHVGIDPAGLLIPNFDRQQRFHEEVARSRWSSSPMEYIDGASSAVLRHPYTIAHASDGDLFVASFTLNHIVRLRWMDGKRAQYKILAKGRELDGPVGMALDDDGALFVASFTNDVVLRVNSTSGELLGKIGSEETLDCPEGIALGPDGRLYVTSFLLPYLSVFEPSSGAFLGKFGALKKGSQLDGAQVPSYRPKAPSIAGAEDLAFDLHGDLHVSAYYSDAVFKLNGSTGELLYTYGRGMVSGPVGVACDRFSGDIFVASYKDNKVLRFTADTGHFLGVAAGTEHQRATKKKTPKKATITSPSGLAFADDGTLWVASYATGAVTRFNGSWSGGRTYWRVTE